MIHTTKAEAPTAWVLTDGKSGMEIQCLGLAEALGLTPSIKRIQVTKPWRWLPPRLVHRPLERLGPKGDRLRPPWPDIIIATGRKAVAPALAIRRASKGASFTIQIQNPVVDSSLFDLVITPSHDRLEGENVITTMGAIGRVNPQSLTAAAAQWAPRFAALPRPRVAVLLGGSNSVYRLTKGVVSDLGRDLAKLARDNGAGLMVTPSRRTGEANMARLCRSLAGLQADIWDGKGENPYFGMLAHADCIVATCDSVNMLSEAAGTGKPVYIVNLPGGSSKFARFHKTLAKAGITRPFSGQLEDWHYPPLDEARRVADEIWRRRRALSGDGEDRRAAG